MRVSQYKQNKNYTSFAKTIVPIPLIDMHKLSISTNLDDISIINFLFLNLQNVPMD
jgi:hypothetical protein